MFKRGNAKHGKFLPFGRARAVVRKLKLQNDKEWKAVRASRSAANSDRSDFEIEFYQASKQDCIYEIGVIVQFRLIKDLEIP